MVRIDPMPGALAAHAGWLGLTAASPALIGVSVLREHLQALLSQEAVPVLVEAIHTARWSTRAYDSRDAAKFPPTWLPPKLAVFFLSFL